MDDRLWTNPDVTTEQRDTLTEDHQRWADKATLALQLAKAMIATGRPIYQNTVTDKVRAKRRAKNKVVRASRKVNRRVR